MSHISERFQLFHVGRLAALTTLMIVVSACFELTQGSRTESYRLSVCRRHRRTEILFRRIRRNELETIQVCRDSVAFIVVVKLFGRLLPPANTENYAKETIAPRSLGGYYYQIDERSGLHKRRQKERQYSLRFPPSRHES